MKRQARYHVFKLTDCARYLTESERLILCAISERLEIGRASRDKGGLECVVVESDWPEYEPTWQAIEKRMDKTAQ